MGSLSLGNETEKMISLRPTVVRRNGVVKKLSPGWVPSPPLQTRSLAEESLQEGWSGIKGVVYIVEPATSEMKALIAKDKFVREEILIPAAEAAKKVNEKMIKKKMMMKKKDMIVIEEEDENGIRSLDFQSKRPSLNSLNTLLKRYRYGRGQVCCSQGPTSCNSNAGL